MCTKNCVSISFWKSSDVSQSNKGRLKLFRRPFFSNENSTAICLLRQYQTKNIRPLHPQNHITFYHIQRTNGYLCRFSPNARIARLYIGSPRNQINNIVAGVAFIPCPLTHKHHDRFFCQITQFVAADCRCRLHPADYHRHEDDFRAFCPARR